MCHAMVLTTKVSEASRKSQASAAERPAPTALRFRLAMVGLGMVHSKSGISALRLMRSERCSMPAWLVSQLVRGSATVDHVEIRAGRQ
jgi:hypothetical protein